MPVALMVAMVSCVQVERPGGGAEALMAFSASTKSGADMGEDLPTWVVAVKSMDADRQSIVPFYTHFFGSLSEFSDVDRSFNTHSHYPDNYDQVIVSGFAPATESDTPGFADRRNGQLLDLTEGWTVVSVNYGEESYDNSVWQDIAVATAVKGSIMKPISSPLVYHYATVRLTFQAQRTPNMSYLGVKDVVVTAAPSITPYELKLVDGAYQAVGKEVALSIPIVNDVNSSYIAQDIATVVDPVYLVLDESHTVNALGPFSVSATYYPIVDGQEDVEGELIVRTYDNVYISDLRDSQGRPVDDISQGDSYRISLLFDQDSFTLSAARVDDWQEGGNITIPVFNPVTVQGGE